MTFGDTGVDAETGMVLHVAANGTVDVGGGRLAGPLGVADRDTRYLPIPNAGRGAMIGKLAYRVGGESPPFFVGAEVVLTIQSPGRLLLGINDDRAADNRGEFAVRVWW